MRNTKFNRGSSVFKCDCCGHMTRLTSDCTGICEPCYEIGSIDNYFNDNDRDHTSDSAASYLAEANRWLEVLRKNAGDEIAAKVKKFNCFVWPNA